MEHIDILTRKQLFEKYSEKYIEDNFYIFHRYRVNDEPFICCCYIENKKLIGLTELEVTQDNCLYINSICVIDSYRNKKIATYLLSYIINYACENDLRLCINHYTQDGRLYIKPLFERMMT